MVRRTLAVAIAAVLGVVAPAFAATFSPYKGTPQGRGFVSTPATHTVHVDIRSPRPEFDHHDSRIQKRQSSSSSTSELLTDTLAVDAYFRQKYPYLNPEDVAVYDAHVDTQGIAYFLVQVINGVVVSNKEASAAVFKGQIISSAGNLLTQAQTMAAKTVSTTAANSPVDAARSIVELFYAFYNQTVPSNFSITDKIVQDTATNLTIHEVSGLGNIGFIDPFYAVQEFWAHDNGTVELAWFFDLQDDEETWVGIVASAASPAGKPAEILAVIEYQDGIDSTVYYSYPPNGTFDPLTVPQAFYTEGQIANKLASPQGWSPNSTSSGNNAVIAAILDGKIEAANASSLSSNLTSAYDPQNPFTPESISAASSMLFFWTNYVHDLLYGYGFDEASGNFQLDNLGRADSGAADQVHGFAQFGYLECPKTEEQCRNNANFATPPDGKPGVMKYYIFNTSPVAPTNRDSTVDRDVVAHELMHGVVSRLTGGRRDGACVENREASGMNEGWADALAWTIAMTPADTNTSLKSVGSWSTGTSVGIRTYPYSTNGTVNPTHYGYINKQEIATAPHDIGSVWSAMLYEVFWNIASQAKAFGDLEDSKGQGSNNIFLRYLITGLKLQPCNPTFIQARDAFLLADATIGNKAYLCAIWQGFAKRGLGSAANGTDNPWMHVPSWTVPAECSAVPDADKVGEKEWVQPTTPLTFPPQGAELTKASIADKPKNGKAPSPAATTPTTKKTGPTGAVIPNAAGKSLYNPISAALVGILVLTTMML